MTRPKLQIIVLFQNLAPAHTYYARSPSPPLSGLLLAALTPDLVEVEVLHEMVRPIDFDTDAEVIALSFMDYCAPHAFRVARRFRELGKTVIAGGRFATTHPHLVEPHFDATVIGEAEGIWEQVIEDLVAGRLRHTYHAPFRSDLAGIPAPRYDLAEPQFLAPVVTEATRGCPFRCSYCQLNIRRRPFRKRPIGDVVGDLEAAMTLPWHRRQLAMFYDNNLGGDLVYAKKLLHEISGLPFAGIGFQFSFNCLDDEEFVDLLAEAGGVMAFVGLESLNQASLDGVRKRHNRVEGYARSLARLRDRGIVSFSGMMLGLDADTAAYYDELPRLLDAAGPSAIMVSIAIPIPGTPLHSELESAGRIADTDLSHYDGDHVIVEPRSVTGEQVLATASRVHRSFYSWAAIARRGLRLVADTLGSGRPWSPRAWRRAAVALVVFLSLSRFQRYHGRRKFLATSSGATRALLTTATQRCRALYDSAIRSASSAWPVSR